MEWTSLGELPPCAGDENLRARARKWSASIINVSQVRTLASGEKVIYAACGEHDKCLARYRFLGNGSIWFRKHSPEQEHAGVDRVARSTSSHPVAKARLKEVKQAALTSDKRPLEINMAFEDPLPGRAVQNCVSKARRKNAETPTLSIKELQNYLDKIRLDLNREGIPESGVHCLYHDVRQDYMVVIWTHGELIHRFINLLGEQRQPNGLVSQTDYSGEVCWSGCKVNIIGVQVYHRSQDPSANLSARRWRKLLIPITLILNPFEDSEHYFLHYQHAKHVVSTLCAQFGFEPPTPIFRTAHGDWTRSLQKHYRESPDCR